MSYISCSLKNKGIMSSLVMLSVKSLYLKFIAEKDS